MPQSVEKLAVLKVPPNVSAEMVEEKLAAIWRDLGEHPELLAEHGIPVTESQPTAERTEGQFGVAETILISIAGALGKEVAMALWNKVIWPELRRRLPASVKIQTDDAES
jgi:hypothetical protein